MKRLAFLLLLTSCATTPSPAARPRAPWPPPPGPLRVILDSDVANEVDDHYALACAFGFPERLKIEGIVAAHYNPKATPTHLDKSHRDAVELLKLARLQIPLTRGILPLRSRSEIPTSDGIEFILEKARSATPEDPIWLVLLGPVTDAVAALLRDPSIADRLVVFWHGRSTWPKKCGNFNALNDPLASRLIFELPCRLVLFDTGTHLELSMKESETRFAPLGPLGAHLHEVRKRSPHWLKDSKSMFDLGDIAALLDPACAPWERVAAPAVKEDLTYDFSADQGEIVRIKDVSRERSYELLEKALRTLR